VSRNLDSHLKAASMTIGAAFVFTALLASCKDESSLLAEPVTPRISRGRAAYQAYCQSCHHPDPRLPGVVGPEIAFSSRELLEARVLRAEYPADYRPKRPGRVMPAMPQLKAEIDGLHAYLNALKRE